MNTPSIKEGLWAGIALIVLTGGIYCGTQYPISPGDPAEPLLNDGSFLASHPGWPADMPDAAWRNPPLPDDLEADPKITLVASVLDAMPLYRVETERECVIVSQSGDLVPCGPPTPQEVAYTSGFSHAFECMALRLVEATKAKQRLNIDQAKADCARMLGVW